jgi:hypothetical protein
VRVSVWFLYVSICGLLCLFLLLKNAATLKQRDVSSTQDNKDSLNPYSSQLSNTYGGTTSAGYIAQSNQQTLDA